MNLTKTSVVIMAGGLGKRMNSDIPKVLHKIGEYPMLVHIIKTSLSINSNNIYVVVGKYKDLIQEEIKKYFNDNELLKITYVIQPEAKGTGHAIQCVADYITSLDENIIILSGDTPLISKESLENMISLYNSNDCVLTVRKTKHNIGLGRIILNNNMFEKIVEEKDANLDEKKIELVNCGIYMIKAQLIKKYIFELNNNNNQKEYYLTDLIVIIKNNNYKIDLFKFPEEREYELIGVNNSDELKYLNNIYKKTNKY